MADGHHRAPVAAGGARSELIELERWVGERGLRFHRTEPLDPQLARGRRGKAGARLTHYEEAMIREALLALAEMK
jgi:hypothetical protein